MNLLLQSGKEVSLEAYHCTPTYAGLLFGNPTKKINENIINNLTYPIEWAKTICIVKETDMYVSDNILKPVINCAWLSSDAIDLIDEPLSRSNIIVIWLSDEQPDKPFRKILVDGIGDFDWNRYAENYWI
jgi:hypothetical protein